MQEVIPVHHKILIFLFVTLFPFSSTLADEAIFAGGCFWCMEADFEKLNGVSEVISGFTGGELLNPTYKGNHEGHYEAVRVIYDPEVVSYQDLLDYYWINIDPFDDQGQFCDKGDSYLSAIFVANAKQRRLAETSRQKVVEQFPDKKVVTPILEAGKFWPIKGKESYHQDYYKKSPLRYRFYRLSCGRDNRLEDIWGKKK
ncbi:peptide-methionine (S)-S-oxide reductase MsrA [Thiohalophilus sp.]|uniref:peptide-methionine (S)-S-oxide reductase MsrA n=1 Tax=Thiohalophilus sp. TaxID=3028392 RepID=UPI003975C07D